MRPVVLPTYYYHDHFTEMLSAVTDLYSSVLTERHHAFIATFKTLSKDAQCLLVRMINRRSRVFRSSAFRYTEIFNTTAALNELSELTLVRSLVEDDYTDFIQSHPKDALIAAARAASFDDVRSSWPKAKLVDFFLSSITFKTAYEVCCGSDFIALGDTEPIEFLLYLYFGKTESDLKRFALRDLGVLRTNKAASPGARFTDEAEARACFYYSRLLRQLELKSENAFLGAISAVLSGPACTTDYASDLRSDAAYLVGSHLEKRGDGASAVQIYRAAPSARCNERLVRLLYTSGDKPGAEDLLRRMIDDPASDDEFIFASDYYARKFEGQRTGRCTELLRAAMAVTVDDTWRSNPEAGVAAALRRQGHAVYHTENTLWNCLFGLLFWDELFESGQIHSNFDWLPQCLKAGTFARLFAQQLEQKLSALEAGTALPLILRTVTARWGTANGVFTWNHLDMDALNALLESYPAGAAAVLRLMCVDYMTMHDGFPDLMAVKNGSVSFVEVKAEGDVIRRNQLTRLHQLVQAGIPANIFRVNFRFDPDQDYVVVDIETTGSWTNGDRITEIGAVKVRNHEIVAEWHSLVNPQRAIPSNITRLTGITNEMVASAPVFSEIADNFMQFMGDGIFVAHSVNFDYVFLSHEYERIERRFRFPKLCTCAGMRRRYPRHKSYSLGNLCQTFEIPLDSHHRALCDAKAAAHLLMLINRKREADREVPVGQC